MPSLRFVLALTMLALPTWGASASLLDRLNEFRLTDAATTAICETMLMAKEGTQSADAVARIRELRLRRLKLMNPRPRVLKRGAYDEGLAPADRETLAGHLRGIEQWGVRADGAAESPRMAGVTLVGADEIAAYYETLLGLRVDVGLMLKVDPTNAGLGQLIGLLNVVLPVGIGIGGYWGVTQTLGAADAVLGSLLALSTPALVYANRFRFTSDTLRRTFDENLREYLTRDGEPRPEAWIFATRSYRVLDQLVDAIWAGDGHGTIAGVSEHAYDEAVPFLRHLIDNPLARLRRARGGDGRTRRRTYVIVDQLLEYDRERAAPRLSIVLRTSSKKPARVTAGARARVGLGELVASPGGG